MICKGAAEEIFKRCTRYELEGEARPIERVIIDDLREEHDQLNMDGFRVLAVAFKELADKCKSDLGFTVQPEPKG